MPETAGGRLSRFAALFELGGKGRIVPMEGLRGVAILMVVLVHHSTLFRAWAEPGSWTAGYADFIHAAGQAGVDLFFALSGYLVYSLALRRRGTLAEFIGRRLRRIYPPFLAAMAVYLVIFVAMPSAAKWPSGGEAWFVIRSLLLLPGVFDIEPLMAVAWSLSYELAFYLAMPLMMAALQMERWPRRRRVVWITALAVAYIAGAALWFPGQMETLPLRVWGHCRILLFAAGMLGWEWFDSLGGKTQSGRRQLGAAMLFALAASACYPLADPALQQPWPALARTLLLAAGSMALIMATFSGEGWLARAFSTAPLRWVGNCSYSLYLMHSLGIQATAQLANRWMAPAAREAAGFWLMLPLCTLVAAAVTIPVFLFVERPFSLRKPALRAG